MNIPDYVKKPSESDCCGSGCTPCVFDVYEQQLQKWKLDRYKCNLSNIRNDLLSPIMYKPFKVLCISACSSNTFVYKFQPVEDYITDDNLDNLNNVKVEGVLPYQPGNYIIITTRNFSRVKEHSALDSSSVDVKYRNIDAVISRDYTPISLASKQNDCVLDILIKLYPNGKMSAFISNLKYNDVVYMRGPFGDFVYQPNQYKMVYMICAGTGIAPLYSLIQTIVDNENDDASIRLCYSCSSLSDILLRAELRRYSSYWNFSADIYLSQEQPSGLNSLDIHYGENIVCGRITSLSIENLIQNKLNSLVLICGTESFNNDMLNFVVRCGFPPNEIHIFK